MKKSNLINQEFYKWTVIGESKNKWGNILWKCKCRCGNIGFIETTKLTSGLSEGCINCSKRQYVGKISGKLFSRIKLRAKNKNLDFNLTKEFLNELLIKQNYRCLFSNLEINLFDTIDINNDTASIDRINSNVGYVQSNIAWVHKNINYIKHDNGVKKFLHYCELVSNFNHNYPTFDKIIKINTHMNSKGYKEISGSYFSSLKHDSNKYWRNILFNITIENIWDKYVEQGGICALTGLSIYFEPCAKNIYKQTASVDRIDSSKSYNVKNIQITHKKINIMKRNFSQDYFIDLCRKVYLWNIRNENI